MKQFLDDFEPKVRGLAAQVVPDLIDVPADQAVGEIHRRCQTAGEQRRKLDDLEKQLTGQSDALRKAETAIQGRHQELEKALPGGALLGSARTARSGTTL
jgi:hypothetical protein